MARFLAVLEYDGTAFSGSQVQPGQRSVQAELERALARLAGEPVLALLAGRTDAGVHAAGQVAAFDLSRQITPGKLAAALNGIMPRDVSVREAAATPLDFHPRYWARSRRYRYRILVRGQRSALLDRCAWHLAERLDVSAMAEAAALLVGRHDFGAFGRPPQGSNTWRTVSRAELDRCGDMLALTVEADAYLRRMVRTVVGTLVAVGRGKLSPAAVARMVATGEGPAGGAAPAKGLTLAAVAYERERLGYGSGWWWSDRPLVAQARDDVIEEFHK